MTRLLADPVAEAVVALRARPSGMRLTEMSRLLSRRPSTLQRSLAALEDAGAVRRSPEPWPRYSLDQGRLGRGLADVATAVVDPERRSEIVRQVRDSAPPAAATAQSIERDVANRVRSLRLTDDVRRSLPVAVARLVIALMPTHVVLFGSQARGDARPDSDVDLLLVLPVLPDARAARIKARRLLADLPIAKDIIVATPTDIDSRGAVVGTILHSALVEGVGLYDR